MREYNLEKDGRLMSKTEKANWLLISAKLKWTGIYNFVKMCIMYGIVQKKKKKIGGIVEIFVKILSTDLNGYDDLPKQCHEHRT